MEQPIAVDAFLAYNEKEDSVTRINEWLVSQGIRTHYFKQAIKVGDAIDESSVLASAATVVVFLGEAGWGPSHLKVVTSAAAQGKPLLPVLIGRNSERELSQASGLFRDRKYLKLESMQPDALAELRDQILIYARASAQAPQPEQPPAASQSEAWIDEYASSTLDRRQKMLQLLHDNVQPDLELGMHLRAAIRGRYQPDRKLDSSASSADIDGQQSSRRSWLFSALSACDAQHEDTRALLMDHMHPVMERAPHVRFWILANAIWRRATYAEELAQLALSNSEKTPQFIAQSYLGLGNQQLIAEMTDYLMPQSPVENQRAALKSLRVVPLPELARVLSQLLEQTPVDDDLNYDLLYALATPAMATASVQFLGVSPIINDLVLRLLHLSMTNSGPTVKQWLMLFLPFEEAMVDAALNAPRSEPQFQEVGLHLAKMLESMRPRAGAPAAGYSSDSIHSQKDYLGIDADVQVLTAVMLAKDVIPPLAIGLFGDWGTGKSFFMRAMRASARERAKEAARPNSKSRYCANVVQIEFNAWHYVDTNLWASLADFIMGSLSNHVNTTETPAQKKQKIEADLGKARDEEAKAQQEKDNASVALLKEKEEQLKLQEKRQAEALKLSNLKTTDLVRLLNTNEEVKTRLRDSIAGLGIPAAIHSVGDLRQAVDEAGSTYRRIMVFVRAMLKNSNLAILVALLLLVPFALHWLQPHLQWLHEHLGPWVVEFSTGLVAAATWLRKVLSTVESKFSKFSEARQSVEDMIRRKQEEPSEEEKNLTSNIEQLSRKEIQASEHLLTISRQVSELQTKLDELKSDDQLGKYLDARNKSDDYRKHQGLISTVRKDFESISTMLADASAQGSNKVERIVLYIDDLDRCPANKVVDVLQAVHLLLAYPIFVVVVGVDSRWLVQALTTHYSELAGDKLGAEANDIATPQHYLEKIFQIPYALRPMSNEGYGRLIGQLMGNSSAPAPNATGNPVSAAASVTTPSHQPPTRLSGVTDTSKAPVPSIAPAATPDILSVSIEPGFAVQDSALSLQPWEATYAESLHELIPSPRAAKRLVNIYRILKARLQAHELAAFEGTANEPGTFQLPLLLLALLIHDPQQAAAYFPKLLDNPSYPTVQAIMLNNLPRGHTTLLAVIKRTTQSVHFPLDHALLKEWVPHVARFSFDLARAIQKGMPSSAPEPAA